MSSVPYPNAQAIFYQQYEAVRRDEVVGILLALFLGGFGIHHFYLRRTGLGILYCCFCWTPLPWVLGFIECFFMPGRVREFNAIQAAGIAAALGIPMPGWGPPMHVTVNVPQTAYAGQPVQTGQTGQTGQGTWQAGQSGQSLQGWQPVPAGTLVACGRCHQTNPPGARFCSGCGASL